MVVRKENEGPAKWFGPVRAMVIRCGDWQIRAEQSRSPIGSPDKWDVFALHKSGERVPPGPNMQASPDRELDRIERLLGWNRREPSGFSWIEDRGRSIPVLRSRRHDDCDCSACLPPTY